MPILSIEKRRRINEKETFGRGRTKYEKGLCPVCGKEFIKYPNKSNIFCSHHCQCEYKYKENIAKWKNGEISGATKRYKISTFVRRYLLEKNNYSCEECGCNLKNKFTGLSILQIHHKDGNAANAKEENHIHICTKTNKKGEINLNLVKYLINTCIDKKYPRQEWMVSYLLRLTIDEEYILFLTRKRSKNKQKQTYRNKKR